MDISRSKDIKVCAACVLPETFPDIQFGADGVCSQCRDFERHRKHHEDSRRRSEHKFQEVIARQVRSGRNGSHPYDVIAAFSGGKDSSFTLQVLKQQYGLKVLAVTFDNGFLSPQARENMRTVTEALDVDHVMLSPNRKVLFRAFRESASSRLYPSKTLELTSSVCNTCMSLVESAVLRMAVEMAVPLIAYGGSPGQAPAQSPLRKLSLPLVRKSQAALVNALWKTMGKDLEPFLLAKRHYEAMMLEQEGNGSMSLYAVHPLALLDYHQDEAVEEIRKLGWKPPTDTGPHSTTCQLNAFASEVHLKRHGYHPAAHEIAELVREGRLSRDAGLAKLATPPDSQAIGTVRKRLGISGPLVPHESGQSRIEGRERSYARQTGGARS